MIDKLLPEAVVVEAYDEEDAREFGDAPLHPEEEVFVARAVLKRRREFALVRTCARRAMEKLGVPAQPVLPGERGAPRWPDGLTGSMTHCEGYGAAALARTAELASLGIDAEPHEPLPEDVLPAVALPAETERLRRLAAEHPEICWDRMLFSAKESVYKAWFPLTRKWLDFSEADIDVHPGTATEAATVTAAQGTFRARLLVPGPLVGGRRLTHFDGRWTVERGLTATAVAVPPAAIR
ncbi:4'-phosphopantetheinyl transferase [Streptomyces sp. NPDC102395]|uniref:4'-phosphopantetheinyl transferase family protein n=1 Tax=Streptomyces sp. NPDC102395 TaxID=3366168 RepID=UPI0037F2334C